jgi:dolichol kinase
MSSNARLDLRRECVRKIIQSTGMVFAVLGRLGGALLLVAILLELVHRIRLKRGGLPVWRQLRSLGERGAGFDPGPFYLAVGIAPVLLFVSPPWSLAIAALPSLADSAAALVGLLADGPKLPGSSRKTIAGSATFFVVATVVSLLVGIPPVQATTLGCVGVIIEWASPRGTDNLLLSAAGILTLVVFS